MNEDEQHLQLLSIFQYVSGGLMACVSLIPLIHVFLGLMLALAPQKFQGNEQMPAAFGLLFVVFGGLFIVVGETVAVLILMTGRFLAKRRHYMFCLVIACLECVMFPFGTILGVFTIVVLNRASVKQLFGVSQTPTY